MSHRQHETVKLVQHHQLRSETASKGKKAMGPNSDDLLTRSLDKSFKGDVIAKLKKIPDKVENFTRRLH